MEEVEKIFSHSVTLIGKDAKSKMPPSDTTVQENNTTFPTDAKLAKKVIDRCNAIADKESILQRQSYRMTSRQLLRDTYNPSHPKRFKKAREAQQKLRTLAGRQLQELERCLERKAKKKYTEDLRLFNSVIQKIKSDKDKIYSLHKPFACWVAKGKAHKPYEYSNKIRLMVDPKSLVVLAIEPIISQMKQHSE
ncbi:MAG: hypothetical protein M0Q53_00055 [Prolixibacteraceae bacterium]|nr:hypothetical protein [Prolixibacteraceae bacterium]